MTIRCAGPLCCFVLLSSVTSTALAYDVELDSHSTFRAYEVRSQASATTWTRRRFIHDLELRVAQPLTEPRPEHTTTLVHVVTQLRVSQEVGDTCFINRDRCIEQSDARSADTYLALAQDGLLDLMLAYADVTGLPADGQVRVGRQLWTDSVGFARVDGITVRAAPTAWLSLSALVGQQVRGTTVAGSNAFEPPGVIRLDLTPRQRLLAGYADNPTRTGIVGAALELGDERVVRGQASVRDVFDDDGVVMRRVGLALRSTPVPEVHLSSSAVIDAADLAVVLGHASARWQLASVTLHANAELMRPRFDLGSIWAYFPTATVQQAEVGGAVNASDVTTIGGGVRGRRTDHSASNAASNTAADHDAGLHLFGSTRVGAYRVRGDGFAWFGDLGELWGVDVGVERPVARDLWAELGASLHRINDPARVAFDGIAAAYYGRIAWSWTAQTHATLELMHAANRFAGHRFSLLASLRVGAWR